MPSYLRSQSTVALLHRFAFKQFKHRRLRIQILAKFNPDGRFAKCFNYTYLTFHFHLCFAIYASVKPCCFDRKFFKSLLVTSNIDRIDWIFTDSILTSVYRQINY